MRLLHSPRLPHRHHEDTDERPQAAAVGGWDGLGAGVTSTGSGPVIHAARASELVAGAVAAPSAEHQHAA